MEIHWGSCSCRTSSFVTPLCNLSAAISGPTPASRSTYVAVQRGDIDIPLGGLQMPAPQPRAHKGNNLRHV